MDAVFERIPELFVKVYDAQLRAWGRDLAKVGKIGTVRLRKPVEPLIIHAGAKRIVGVRLIAEPERGPDGATRLVISPSTDADEEAIRRHVRDLAAEMLH